MTAFQLFVFAPESEVYTFSEYKGFLEEVGFTNVAQHSDRLISAIKRSNPGSGVLKPLTGVQSHDMLGLARDNWREGRSLQSVKAHRL